MLALLIAFAAPVAAQSASTGNQITILYDAFSNKPGFALDWGYAALVEFEGKRVLFDTGNNAPMLNPTSSACTSTCRTSTLWCYRIATAIILRGWAMFSR
jgi:hypothetical protein